MHPGNMICFTNHTPAFGSHLLQCVQVQQLAQRQTQREEHRGRVVVDAVKPAGGEVRWKNQTEQQNVELKRDVDSCPPSERSPSHADRAPCSSGSSPPKPLPLHLTAHSPAHSPTQPPTLSGRPPPRSAPLPQHNAGWGLRTASAPTRYASRAPPRQQRPLRERTHVQTRLRAQGAATSCPRRIQGRLYVR